jgi:hypothetical protein
MLLRDKIGMAVLIASLLFLLGAFFNMLVNLP